MDHSLRDEMKTREYESPTLKGLTARIAELQAQADALRKREMAEVITRIRIAIAHYDLTAGDLGLIPIERKASPYVPARKAKASVRGRNERMDQVLHRASGSPMFAFEAAATAVNAAMKRAKAKGA